MEKKVFAKGFCFKKVFFIFVITSIFGAYWEEICWIMNKGYWEPRRALIYGPFSPVYGISFVMAALCFCRKKMRSYKVFLYSFLLGGFCEYILSIFQEVLFNSRSWDYTGYFLNIDGRTTIPFMIVWGLFGLLFTEIVYPFMSKMIEKIPYKIGEILYKILLIFMIFDITISIGACLRQRMRLEGNKPITIVGEFFDKFYPDKVIDSVYKNSVYKGK